MSRTRDTLREKLLPGNETGGSSKTLISALEEYVDAEECAIFHLPGNGPIVREHDGNTDTIDVSAGGSSAVVVTDKQLLFLSTTADETAVVEISYVDIKRVDAHDGLLRSKLSVAVWGEGEYRLKIADASELGAVVNYLREASECWDRVISTLDDCYDHVEDLGEHIEADRPEAARGQREQATERLDRARSYVDRAEIRPPGPLVERIAEAEREKARTEVRTRISSAQSMITDGTHQTEAREYTEAYRNFWYARDHLETALSVCRQSDLHEPPEITSKLETLESRLRQLEVKPRALAEQACERAQGTDSLDTEIEAWQEAFEHYRDALTAGWGTDLDFSGETEMLRFKTEIVVGELIDSRCELAKRLEAEAEDCRNEDPKKARRCYEVATEQLEHSLHLASEFRSGDAGEIETMLARLGQKRYELADS